MGYPVTKMYPICEVKQKGLCIHEKMMLGMLGLIVVVVILVILLLGACGPRAPAATPSPPPAPPTDSRMGGVMAGQASALAPPVTGFYKGGEVLFIHTEASDPQVASMLTRMMGPQVVLVPSLAQAPLSMLGNVYVFTDGVRGGGPFGFQADVFDSAPGDPAYSPLRAIYLVSWKEEVTPRELRSAEEVKAAESRGEVTIVRPGAVVNMPILTWPGGQR